ncbi:MAG: glycosyltransferase [Niabella sp.]|nr:glycosyltransferase [Niabella sp.]
MHPFISICIPAYNRADRLKRLLDSILMQEFRDFEVIITDDSNTDAVEKLTATYSQKMPIRYQRNLPALGTPENWNEGIRKAGGAWIKLMHDDDWFATPAALGIFADQARLNPCAFIFSAYNNVYDNGAAEAVYPSLSRLKKIRQFPLNLWASNCIGPPTVVMHPNDGKHIYDNRMKWLVDIDMYIRRMAGSKTVYIPERLINVGMGSTQVTAAVKNDPAVEIPEHFLLLEKAGLLSLKHLWVYDYHWRFIRNFGVTDFQTFYQYGYTGPKLPLYKSMIHWQNKVPQKAIKNGFVSKSLMFLHYLLNKNKI